MKYYSNFNMVSAVNLTIFFACLAGMNLIYLNSADKRAVLFISAIGLKTLYDFLRSFVSLEITRTELIVNYQFLGLLNKKIKFSDISRIEDGQIYNIRRPSFSGIIIYLKKNPGSKINYSARRKLIEKHKFKKTYQEILSYLSTRTGTKIIPYKKPK